MNIALANKLAREQTGNSDWHYRDSIIFVPSWLYIVDEFIPFMRKYFEDNGITYRATSMDCEDMVFMGIAQAGLANYKRLSDEGNPLGFCELDIPRRTKFCGITSLRDYTHFVGILPIKINGVEDYYYLDFTRVATPNVPYYECIQPCKDLLGIVTVNWGVL